MLGRGGGIAGWILGCGARFSGGVWSEEHDFRVDFRGGGFGIFTSSVGGDNGF